MVGLAIHHRKVTIFFSLLCVRKRNRNRPSLSHVILSHTNKLDIYVVIKRFKGKSLYSNSALFYRDYKVLNSISTIKFKSQPSYLLTQFRTCFFCSQFINTFFFVYVKVFYHFLIYKRRDKKFCYPIIFSL